MTLEPLAVEEESRCPVDPGPLPTGNVILDSPAKSAPVEGGGHLISVKLKFGRYRVEAVTGETRSAGQKQCVGIPKPVPGGGELRELGGEIGTGV